MCDKQAFVAQTQHGAAYYPPTYHNDGFVHATREPSMLLNVGNHFYKSVPGEWICIALDPALLGCRCRYEPAAPVGNTAALKHDSDEPLFPHIYGGIYKLAVVAQYAVVRGEDGSFLSIEGLVQGNC
jgi:uncharacterized protein (DUF952 family)